MKRTMICVCAVVLLAGQRLFATSVQEISQYGITWKFDKKVEAGQFVTGDWWVIGPVTVVQITPQPGPVETSETVTFKRGRRGSTSLSNNNLMRNGSMVVMACSTKQGYDSRSATYDPNLSIKLPYQLEPSQSLISTISNTNFPTEKFAKEIMWKKEKVCQVALRAAAVLTCLSAVPPSDAFRPTYVGREKVLYREKDLRWELLPKLAPAGDVPSWQDFERYYQRPWLDHLSSYMQQELNPYENQPDYGREHARLGSMASLMLSLDVPNEKKRKLLIGLVQCGLDLSGCAKNGGVWNMGGGISSGRKWPIVFASLMLGDPKIIELPATAVFHEDAQTYYGKGWFGQTVLWQMVTHHGPRQPYEEKPPEEWGEWDQDSDDYRSLNTSGAWVGEALAARYMKAVKLWRHDAFFDYMERWMRPDDPFQAARGKHERPTHETKALDPFVTAMWKAHRANAPEQEMSGVRMKWVWKNGKGEWEQN